MKTLQVRQQCLRVPSMCATRKTHTFSEKWDIRPLRSVRNICFWAVSIKLHQKTWSINVPSSSIWSPEHNKAGGKFSPGTPTKLMTANDTSIFIWSLWSWCLLMTQLCTHATYSVPHGIILENKVIHFFRLWHVALNKQ